MTALAFLPGKVARPLFDISSFNRDLRVTVDRLWVSAVHGSKEALVELRSHAQDPRTSRRACRHLKSLGESLPSETGDYAFTALAKMCEELADSEAFGRPPESIEIMDSRALFWPPDQKVTACWLCRYSFRGGKGEHPVEGVGFVAADAVIYPDPRTADMAAEDLYALYCAILETPDFESYALENLVGMGRLTMAYGG